MIQSEANMGKILETQCAKCGPAKPCHPIFADIMRKRNEGVEIVI